MSATMHIQNEPGTDWGSAGSPDALEVLAARYPGLDLADHRHHPLMARWVLGRDRTGRFGARRGRPEVRALK